MDGPKPYESIGFGAMHGPKPYESIGFGAIDGPKPYARDGLCPSIGRHSRPCHCALSGPSSQAGCERYDQDPTRRTVLLTLLLV